MKYQTLINNGIKRLREKTKLSQEKFAEKIGFSTKGISNIERNRYQPNPDTIDKICEVFGVHPVDLLMEYPEDLDKQGLLSQINAILQTYSQEDLEKVCKVLNVLKK